MQRQTIAALFVETGGTYCGLPDVEPWGIERDARGYDGPFPVVAHPPCQRWGRFWHGSPRKPHQFRLGSDLGCFATALTAVRNFGGVLEHPAHSLAWRWFGLSRPAAGSGWVEADQFGGWTCSVEQGHYGHAARKPTWLYACRVACLNSNGAKPSSASTLARWSFSGMRRRGVGDGLPRSAASTRRKSGKRRRLNFETF
jgi:hypothetical protein